jgi:rhamnogalacturonyl hydrolase YesR
MTKTLPFIKYLFLLLALFSLNRAESQIIEPAEVKLLMKEVADWQIAHFKDNYSGRKKPHHPLAWTNGALYVGMLKWAEMADDETYFNWMKKISNDNEWKLHHRKYHADDHTVGQMYIDIYKREKKQKMIQPTIDQFDFLMANRATTDISWKKGHQDRWNWCDALFMSPPVWAKLYNITGEEKYLDFLMEEFKATTKFLFDKKEHLYFRDERYIAKRDFGNKVFWSRGNGWVFAGLANVMDELDPSSKEYKYFLKIYKKMAKKLLEIQTPAGHWSMSLLSQDHYPTPETSGSSFYVFGLAWGLNNGILKDSAYKVAVYRGWNAMKSYVTKEGMLGYVQPIGAAPGKAWKDKSEVYGTGAFLSAGSEVYKMIEGK